eukprot:gene9046-16167_t
MATVLVYLSEPEEGGETVFPKCCAVLCGNQMATVLVYLSELEEGGETVFPKDSSAGLERGSGVASIHVPAPLLITPVASPHRSVAAVG